MLFNKENLDSVLKELQSFNATLVAVSKTKSVEAIKEVYDYGHKIFGENYVQELVEKHSKLPTDIQWHFVGHLQTNKVKIIAPFVSMIHSVDSWKLLQEINKQAAKYERVIDCLLQIHIAQEETKFGLSFEEAETILKSDFVKQLPHIRITGLMGMATLTENETQIRNEFQSLKNFYDVARSPFTIHHSPFNILSMGMTSDYKIALEEGSNMMRIGSAIFGLR